MLTTPFLTDLDSRAAVKGSRDPLGIQQIWTRLGRHVVGNLTTVSNSLRDFTTLLLGYYFAARLADELGPGTELATFLKWEQLAAYARATANEDWAFRGTERVRKNLSESPPVTLSDDSAAQILGNQRIYDLWGLYSMPGRASGLIDGEQPRLTPPAVEFVESLYLPILEEGAGKDARRIQDALRGRMARIDVKGSDAPMIKAVGTVLRQRLTACGGSPTSSTRCAALRAPSSKRTDVSEIPRAVLSEHFQERMKGRRLRSAVFLTFQFDPGFFEQEVLPVA